MRLRRSFTYYLGMFGVIVGVQAIALAIIGDGLGDLAHWRNWLAVLAASAIITVGAWAGDRREAGESLEKARKIIRGESDRTD